MSRFRDLVGVAWTGLTARKVRTLLIMLGPIVGVAAMVGHQLHATSVFNAHSTLLA